MFEERTGALIGTFGYSDYLGECGTFNTVAGEPFYCPSGTECDLCPGDGTPPRRDLPACE